MKSIGEDIENYGISKQEWLQEFWELPNRIRYVPDRYVTITSSQYIVR
ncbi:MAG: hypothetical protein QNJ72_06590 [Pleurocapsa sp. MO_226.B13]|nr:hypothetical protein [Pleurocapsa sp. MO_226.B13]